MSEIKDAGLDRRRSRILELINRNGKVKVSQLVKEFDISDVTIRNDLTEMEQEGMLRRIHGGAVSTKKLYYDMSLNDRMDINKEEKMRIAKVVVGLVMDGDTLMIDSGTTTCYIAKELAERKNLTVVTNAIQIAKEFAYYNMAKVILLGGNLDLQYQFTSGNDTITQLQKYRADKMIIATDGISAKYGLTTYHYEEADVSRQMIERANEVIAVADYSKIGREGFAFISPLESIDVLVTNTYADNTAALDEIRQKGIIVEEA